MQNHDSDYWKVREEYLRKRAIEQMVREKDERKRQRRQDARRRKPFACRLGFHSWCHDSFRGYFCNWCFKEVSHV
jgi:hypothetical protein